MPSGRAAPDPHEPAVPPDGGLVRVRLDLAYDGTGFSGWAAQAGRRTVQDVLQESLRQLLHLRVAPALTVAGRTDAGVHARGQVAHVDLDRVALDALPARSSREPTEALLVRLAGILPADVRVHGVRLAPKGFDARFSAAFRRYAYRISDHAWGVWPQQRSYVQWHDRPLDGELMSQAAELLRGEHDFAAFCRRRKGASTVRALSELRFDRDADGLLVGTVVADAFCHNMVRALVGALIAVGEGRRPVRWPADVLAARVRDSAVNVVGPRGLTLEEVGYPADELLADRATLTRRRREPCHPTSGATSG